MTDDVAVINQFIKKLKRIYKVYSYGHTRMFCRKRRLWTGILQAAMKARQHWWYLRTWTGASPDRKNAPFSSL